MTRIWTDLEHRLFQTDHRIRIIEFCAQKIRQIRVIRVLFLYFHCSRTTVHHAISSQE
jgi:hypothetical protein